MKKIFSLALAAAMMMSAIPAAYAAENEANYDAGTQIELLGSGTEEWTVTVPAKMNPGQTGTVKAEGTWAADKYLSVGSTRTVTLTYGAQSMDVAITGGSFILLGNSAEPVSKEVEIAVEDATRLFGKWTGTIVYTVNLSEKGDVNRDGVINADDLVMVQNLANGTPTEDNLLYADFNSDGIINNRDINAIKSILQQNGIEFSE